MTPLKLTSAARDYAFGFWSAALFLGVLGVGVVIGRGSVERAPLPAFYGGSIRCNETGGLEISGIRFEGPPTWSWFSVFNPNTCPDLVP